MRLGIVVLGGVGFSTIVAPFGSVNESTWEHLKLFYWPGLAFAIVQHAYLRHRVNNFWAAKAVSAAFTSGSVAMSAIGPRPPGKKIAS